MKHEKRLFGISNELIRSNYHRRKATKLTFQALALCQRVNARNVSFVYNLLTVVI